MQTGIGASPGVAIGIAKVIKKQKLVFDKARTGSYDEEKQSFEAALSVAKSELIALAEKTKVEIGIHESEIFNAHQMMLEDPEFTGQILARIQTGDSAPHAVRTIADEFITLFSAIEDAYLRERAADLKDVSDRLIRKLLNLEDLNLTENGIILIAEDLTPSDTAKIDKNKVLGFITEIGGTTSHSAIMARTIGIPAIVGVGHRLKEIVSGDIIALDGETGVFYNNPSDDILTVLKEKMARLTQERKDLEVLKGQETKTLDGHTVEVACNIGGVKDLVHVLENDGEGIGLFRSEFLYMDRENLPTEEEQFAAYKAVLVAMGDKPVVIRTLDVGGDKNLPYLNIPKEENPFLGFRAIRYCLKNTDVFKTQIKALLRAGVYGNLRIMMPMISGVQEVRSAKSIFEICKSELRAENIPFSETYQLGIMIEIPSAAIIADILAKEVDFFSIGTNDLIQYTVAVDRMNQDIADLYTPYHPAVLRLIYQVIQAGKKNGIWVGMCGEAAGNPTMIPLLLGMGLEEFSMNPSKVLRARKQIQGLSLDYLEKHVETVLNLPDPQAVEQYIQKHLLSM